MVVSLFDIRVPNPYGTRVQLISAMPVLAFVLATCSSDAADTPPKLSGPGRAASVYLSPSALTATSDGKLLFVACATAERVLVFDTVAQRVSKSISVPHSPLGLALSPDGRQLFATCAAPQSTVCIIDVASLKVTQRIPTGHTAMAPVCSPDGETLYVCNRFDDSVAVINLKTQRESARIPVAREPSAAALTPDGTFLFVANHLPAGRADLDDVGACVSVIDTAARRVIKSIPLPSGSTIVRDIRISPDGELACVTHVLARFHLPTTQIERGWIDNNALSILDVRHQRLINTVLLDNISSGAANPWAVAWTADGKQICVTHAGTHELSVIDAPALLRKLMPISLAQRERAGEKQSGDSVQVSNDLAFLAGLRQRIPLQQNGPRSLAVIGGKAYIGNYFSDTLSVVDLSAPALVSRSIPLGPPPELSTVRRGEVAFNDGSLCFQGWQSCASCHSSDGRVDSLNWDLLNDGLGNPKNTKSLLFAYKTPPSMALGIRANARLAVRAGFRYILFTVPSEETASAVDEYLETLKPGRSPLLEKGKLSAAAARGKKLFMEPKVACASCHPAGLYTDLKPYDVGTSGKFDKPGDKFFTPTLVEVWRTAPYLHDGSAATMREVLTTRNQNDQHGKTSHLTEREIQDLAAFVGSL